MYVILGYYYKAEKNFNYENKITNQKYNNKYIKNKIKEISNFHSSALHWNIQQLDNELNKLVSITKKSYNNISKITNVKMHDVRGIDKFLIDIKENTQLFKDKSRAKAKLAQFREVNTTQPKETLFSISKACITIENYLGGLYYLTVDEILILKNELYLIECKHTLNNILPSIGDIKDGLVKMILFSNLKFVKIGDKEFKHKAKLVLSSSKLMGKVNNKKDKMSINNFFVLNNFNSNNKALIESLFTEANNNNFIIEVRAND